MVVILLILFGFLRSFAIYCLAANDYITERILQEDIREYILAAFVYAICGFAVTSLFLSIERCIAVYKPKQYERYSDKAILPCITLFTTLLFTVILGFWANKNTDNQIPLITVTTAAGIISLIVSFQFSFEEVLSTFECRVATCDGFTSFSSRTLNMHQNSKPNRLRIKNHQMIAITVWVRAKHLWKNKSASLGQRFQIAETNRTSPIYLSISVNESICISAMSVMGLLMIGKENTETMGTNYFLVHLLDACGAWRIIFINFTLIYYSYLAKKTRLLVMAHMSKSAQESTVDHFTGLKDMWK
ncbi:hypothetical protein Y032_0018g3518 [Ancylostoma ceylanicum]|uniref:G-protein coupled receptors family 1 profile domain-containing protein n=2 Tax=Ancylostoma ceylanicum TaxID=53326 RepID=A0A016V4V2_9BILA|nr:hypothetical protein Y032_0018g3518 [Ancylostoma ceylanicum]